MDHVQARLLAWRWHVTCALQDPTHILWSVLAELRLRLIRRLVVLPVYIGLGRAQEYFYSNKPITAQQAMEWGMVNQVGETNFQALVMRVAGKLAAGPLGAFAAGKQALITPFCPISKKYSTTKPSSKMKQGNQPSIEKAWRLFWGRENLNSSDL